MRRFLVSVLMIPLLLLAGCGEREAAPEEVFASFRESLGAAEELSAQVRLTAETAGTSADYVLAVTADAEETTLEILEPALIEGIRATVKAGETTMAFDGVMLGAGPVDEEGVTPISAVPAILRAMTEGYAELCWREGSCVAARYYAGESSACTVWLAADTLVPVAAEIASDGRTVIACRFTDWQLR